MAQPKGDPGATKYQSSFKAFVDRNTEVPKEPVDALEAKDALEAPNPKRFKSKRRSKAKK